MQHVNLITNATAEDTRDVEFLRLPSVLRRTGLGRSTIYRLMADAQFPAAVKLSGRAIGWRRSDLDRWSDARRASDSAPARPPR